jgi:ribosomal protein S18 acetylase RimI-like enzyme
MLPGGVPRPGPAGLTSEVETLLVAAEDGEIVAFLDFGREPESLELRRLYTQPEGTSRGIGSALLSHLESSLAAGTRYRIVVLAANERGLAFWQRHGFHTVSEIDGVEHFTAHRGVRFDKDARPEPLVVMDRVVV